MSGSGFEEIVNVIRLTAEGREEARRQTVCRQTFMFALPTDIKVLLSLHDYR